MRCCVFLFLLIFTWQSARSEEAAAPSATQNFLVIRSGEQLQSPHIFTYRLTEWSQQRGRWILPDIGYYDTGRLNDRIFFTGGGGEVIHNQRMVWTQIVYIGQATGSATQQQRMLWIWPVLDAKISERWSSETVLYPTIPLNKAERWAFDIDRTKLEYSFGSHFRAGAGYSACVGATTSWTNKPLATATVSNHTGAWEFWLERMPGGAQAQVRYTLTK